MRKGKVIDQEWWQEKLNLCSELKKKRGPKKEEPLQPQIVSLDALIDQASQAKEQIEDFATD